MSAVSVVVEGATPEARQKYWDIVSNVFQQADPGQLRQGMAHFGRDTQFFAVEIENVYASVMFVTPVTIAGSRFGGIGGVCSRQEYCGLGYGRLVLERALQETASTYGTLLLWTRIPDYFSKFGFVEMSQLFTPDVDGSSPMLFFHDEKAQATIAALRDLPRKYF